MNVSGNFGVPVPMAANASAQVKPFAGVILGFICTVGGTLDAYFGNSTAGTHVLVSLPVSVGLNAFAFSFPDTGLFIALSGGAAGSAVVA